MWMNNKAATPALAEAGMSEEKEEALPRLVGSKFPANVDLDWPTQFLTAKNSNPSRSPVWWIGIILAFWGLQGRHDHHISGCLGQLAFGHAGHRLKVGSLDRLCPGTEALRRSWCFHALCPLPTLCQAAGS